MNSMEYGPRDHIGYGKDTPEFLWPGGAKIAISIVLNYEEGSERTPLNGDNTTEVDATELGPGLSYTVSQDRDTNLESLYDYGSRSGVWRILRLFKQYGIKITSYAVAMALQKNPEVAKALEEDGHEIASHGLRWVDRSGWTEAEERQYAEEAIEVIGKLAPSGKEPVGWYYGMVASKGGARSRSLVADVFAKRGKPLLYYSDNYSDDLPFYVPYPGQDPSKGLLIVPYNLDSNDYKNAGYSAFVSPNDFSDYLIATFDELYAEGVAGRPKMFSIGLHCRIIGRAGRLAGLRKFIEHVKAKAPAENAWFATREEIAQFWTEKFPYAPKQ